MPSVYREAQWVRNRCDPVRVERDLVVFDVFILFEVCKWVRLPGAAGFAADAGIVCGVRVVFDARNTILLRPI